MWRGSAMENNWVRNKQARYYDSIRDTLIPNLAQIIRSEEDYPAVRGLSDDDLAKVKEAQQSLHNVLLSLHDALISAKGVGDNPGRWR